MKGTIQYLLIEHHCVTHPVLGETHVSCNSVPLQARGAQRVPGS